MARGEEGAGGHRFAVLLRENLGILAPLKYPAEVRVSPPPRPPPSALPSQPPPDPALAVEG
jgi:hypothetical protein